MTPLERAAQAIATELAKQEPQQGGTYFVDAAHPEAAIIDGTFDLTAVARAVLSAVREPSALMLETAGEEERWDGKLRSSSENEAEAAAVWRAMIDVALHER